MTRSVCLAACKIFTVFLVFQYSNVNITIVSKGNNSKISSYLAPNNNRFIFYSSTEPFISYDTKNEGNALINGLYKTLINNNNNNKNFLQIQDLIEKECNNKIVDIKDKNGKIHKGIIQIETSKTGMDIDMRSNLKFSINKNKNIEKIKIQNTINDKRNILYI